MLLYLGNLLGSVALLLHVIYLKRCYMKHKAVCLDYTFSGKSFIAHHLYEYELEEEGEEKIYQSWGIAYLYPKIGKRYRVLIHKKNHNKVVGYTVYVVHMIMGGLILAGCIIVMVLTR